MKTVTACLILPQPASSQISLEYLSTIFAGELKDKIRIAHVLDTTVEELYPIEDEK